MVLGSAAQDSTLAGDILIRGDAPWIPTELGLTAGTYFPLAIAQHTSVPEWKTADTYSVPTGSVWIKTTEPKCWC